jgi:abhydrolase domain-containing protein 6
MKTAIACACALLITSSCAWVAPSMLDNFRAGLRDQGGLVEKTVHAGPHDVAYVEGGAGAGPTVLLLHGATGQKEDWFPVAVQLTSTHHVIVPDMAPFGATAPAPGVTYDLATSTRGLAEFIDALGLRDVHIVGSSMYGHVGAEYARTHADRVKSLTVVGAPGIKAKKRSALFVAIEDRNELPFRTTTRDEVASFAASYLWVRAPDVPGFLMDHVYDQRVARNALDVAVVEAYLPSRYDLDAHVAELTVPLFALWGDSDPQIDASAIDVLRTAPGFQDATVLPECGHLPHVEYPDKAAATIARFIRRATPEST